MRSVGRVVGDTNRAEIATTRRRPNKAGSNLLARRDQKARSFTAPAAASSVSSSVVIRKPESVKNKSTPRNPPRIPGVPKW